LKFRSFSASTVVNHSKPSQASSQLLLTAIVLEEIQQNAYQSEGEFQIISQCIFSSYSNRMHFSQTLTGKEIEIDIEPTDKVDRIKERVEEKEGIPPQQQRLIFSGKQM
jgi:hypothetical protein